jgi:putative transposase
MISHGEESVLQSLQVRLETNAHQKELLLETMRHYNSAANFIAEKAFELKLANRYALQKLLYREIRERFHLSAQFTVRVISKVVESYKKDRSRQPRFRMNGAIQYDQRNLSWKGIDSVSLLTLNGRIKLQTRISNYQRAKASFGLRSQVDLLYRNHEFYLVAIVEAPEAPQYQANDTLGVDLGVHNLATDSEGEVFSGKQVEQTRQRYNELRASLQRAKRASQHRSAQRKLKKISGRERRFKRNTNHVISKRIVSKAKGTHRRIALEDLKGIRSRVTVRHTQRDRHSKWAFGELRFFIEYKARCEGAPITIVNPRNSSIECPECHSVDKRNRPTRDTFRCISCGFEAMSDHVGARIIASRARFNEPIVAPLFSVVTISLPSGGRS